MNFLKIAGSDIKGIFKNRFIRVSVIAIIVVPLLYSLLYLDAFWDPYSKLADMPVAVVNLDHGTNLDGKFESYGQDFVDKLKDDDRVGWRFVSEDDANEGLEGNKYYAKLVITEDFSKDIVSAKEGTPKQASLKFVCNEKKNFLAAQVNSKVESALQSEITKTVTDTYVTGAFDNLYKVKDGMDAATDGSGQLNDGLNTANDGSNQLYDGQVQLNDGILQLKDGLEKLNGKAPELTSGVVRLNDGIGKLYRGYNDKIHPAIEGIDAALGNMQSEIAKNGPQIAELNKGANLIQAGAPQIAAASDDLVKGVNTLIDGTKISANAMVGVEQLLKAGKIQEAIAIVEKINLANAQSKSTLDLLKTKVNQYGAVMDTYTSGSLQLAVGTESLIGSVGNLNNGIGELRLKGPQALLMGLDDPDPEKGFGIGLKQEYDGLGTLHAKVTGTDGDPENLGLSTSASKLYSGSDTALTGSNKLVSGQSDLKDGIIKLHDGSTELATKLKDGSGELNDGLKNTSQDMGTFVATPVNLEIAPINPVPNYGSGFAPYFINLSLWIGAIMMFFVISAKTEQYEGATKFDKAFGKFLSFGFVGILQAVLVGIVVLSLGLSPGNVPLYFASLIFFSLVYIAIVQCLISLFGDAGRLLSIVLLIMQLTACAGTFPLELVPKIFVVVNPIMPFTYSVDALREICSASVINYGVLGKDFIVLAIVMVVFLTISIVGATFGEKMQRIIEGRKEGVN